MHENRETSGAPRPERNEAGPRRRKARRRTRTFRRSRTAPYCVLSSALFGKSIQRFQDRVRQRTKRRVPLKTKELIAELSPLLRGWGEYYKRAHVRKLFNQLDRWIVRRIWSHRFKRWPNGGWTQLPMATLYGEYELVNLVGLIPSLASRSAEPS
jgi:Group II intron, maturase-specific domain